jgi:hypothetical protein
VVDALNIICGISFGCCLPLLFVLAVIMSISKLAVLSKFHQDRVSLLENIWHRTILLTPRGFTALFLSIFAIWISTQSIDASMASTAGLFFLICLFFIWIAAQALNIYIFIKQQVGGKPLVDSHLNFHFLQEGDAIRQNLELDVPEPLGFLLKVRVLVPRRLGHELRVVGLNKQNGKKSIELVPQYSKRGEYELGPTIIELEDLFGFTKIIISKIQPQKLRIVPFVKKINRLAWQQSASRIGDQISKKRIINTDELYDIKPYVRGDDVRRVHWKLTAKTGELMLRKPELTFLDITDLVIVIDNQSPLQAGLGDLSEVVGGAELLDRMVVVAGTILDFASRFNVNIKVFYYSKKNTLKRIDPLQNRREQWLHELAKIKWIWGNSDSFIFNIPDEELKRTGFFLLTAETKLPRVNSILENTKSSMVEVVYFPIESYIEYVPKKGKSILERFKTIAFNSESYVDQGTSYDFLKNMFLKRAQKASEKKYLNVEGQSKIIQQRLSSLYSNPKIIKMRDNYLRILEGYTN